MGSHKQNSPLGIKSNRPIIEGLFPKTPTSSKHSTHSQKQKSLTPNTCKGTSVSTGQQCRRSVGSDNCFCFQHKDQMVGKNIYGIPTTPRKNNFSKKEINYSKDDDNPEVIDLTNVTNGSTNVSSSPQEKLDEIESQMKTLSLNDSKTLNDDLGSTKITNKEVQIKEELSKKSTRVSIDHRGRTSSPTRSDLECTPKKILSSTKLVRTDTHLPMEGIDDTFLQTTNKESFQTPNLVTPSNELISVPSLSISPSQHKSPTDSLFGTYNTEQKSTRKKLDEIPESSCQSSIVHTPTRTRIRENKSHVSMSDIQNTTPDITPTISRNQNCIDLTDDYYSPSPSSPLNTCQGRIKNGGICNRKIKPSVGFCHLHKREVIESLEEELETAVLVPGRARLTWLRYGEWIKPDLPPETKRSLRSEMEKPIADKDEPGFIYAYRLLEGPNSANSQCTLYKVGRTTNVHRRLYQWAKQCGYTPELIEGFPNFDILSTSSPQETFLIDGEALSLNSGSQSEPFPRCKYTHRAERLIHIELGARFKPEIEKCKNCGFLHREWFRVKALNLGNDKSVMHRWEEVRSVIVHWISYIERVYGTG